MTDAPGDGGAPAPSDDEPIFTSSFEPVLRDELAYIERRRRIIGDRRGTPDQDVWGLCISGGGVRSATFALGVIQALTRDRVMPLFDYLSTVSGGGYIGSAITSLLSERSFEGPSGIGLARDASPFFDDEVTTEAKTAEATRLTGRIQLDHLRNYGEYLARRGGGPFSLDVQRIVGILVHGIVHNLLLYGLLLAFLASTSHFTLSLIDERMAVLNPERLKVVEVVAEGGYADRLMAVAETWWLSSVYPPIDEFLYGRVNADGTRETESSLVEEWPSLAVASATGVGWTLLWLFAAGAVARRVTRFARAPVEPDEVEGLGPGFSRQDAAETRFSSAFNLGTGLVVMGLLLGYAAWHFEVGAETLTEAQHQAAIHSSYSTALFVPLSFFLFGAIIAQLGTGLVESWVGSNPSRRSLFGAIGGVMAMGAVAGAALPVAIVLVFAVTKIGANNFLLAFGALGLTYYLSAEPKPDAQLSGIRSALARWRFQLVGVSVAFSAVLGFSWMLEFLHDVVYPAISDHALDAMVPTDGVLFWLHSQGPGWSHLGPALVVSATSVLALVVLGIVVNSNRISPHYFYRDRLSEAYLTTGAYVRREDPEDRPGRPVAVLRDHRHLRMCDVGTGNESGPYHLIVTSINLAGARELARKLLKSEHFVFAKYWVGSNTTGWVRTAAYRGGETKLARAMTISAAAAASGAGRYTSRLWAFVMTLFNVRLGFWMENPWYYRAGSKARRLPHERLFRFWPRYLWREMRGSMDASGELVNLSDGGHTGDNLGILPLLYRRCRLIVVCDGEQDADYTFGSFADAVRLALIERGIEVDIDTSGVRPTAPGTSAESVLGPARARTGESVIEGRIRYPRDGDTPPSEGRIVYIKSSLPVEVPLHVGNYALEHPDFPHESTGDQFFDNTQFEAYRALGETIGATVRSHLVSEDALS